MNQGDGAAVRAAVVRFLSAVESRDPVAVAACFTADATYRNMPHDPATGRSGIEQLFRPILSRSERVVWDIVSAAYAGDTAWLERSTGSCPPIPSPTSTTRRAEVAVPFCRRHNDLLAELIAVAPDRLGGLAALPVQDVAASFAALERAVGLGLLGASIGTDPGQRARRGRARSAHPSPTGIDNPVRDPRLRRFDLELVVGFAAEKTLAVATLIYGGVLDRHPGLDLCLTHGGGGAPFLSGRMRAATRPVAESAERQRPPAPPADLKLPLP